MELTVYKWPSEKLREKATAFNLEYESHEWLGELIEALFDTMYEDGGIGLAATQCGVTKKVFVMDTQEVHSKGIKRAFVNPVVVDYDETFTNKEGCLSFPGVWAEVERLKNIEVTYYCVEDKTVKTEKFSGIESICIQHEIDHLYGKVFVDHLSQAKRDRALAKYRRTK